MRNLGMPAMFTETVTILVVPLDVLAMENIQGGCFGYIIFL